MHPKGGLRCLVSRPGDAGSIQEVNVPCWAPELQGLGVQVAEAAIRVPGMNHPSVLEGFGLLSGSLDVITFHHGKPYLKTFQVVFLEFVEEASDNTLSVLAHRSGGRKNRY